MKPKTPQNTTPLIIMCGADREEYWMNLVVERDVGFFVEIARLIKEQIRLLATLPIKAPATQK